jgi:hypothetical protein
VPNNWLNAPALVIARLDRAIHALIHPVGISAWITRSGRVMTIFWHYLVVKIKIEPLHVSYRAQQLAQCPHISHCPI